MEDKLLTFEDLEFKPHHISKMGGEYSSAVQAKLEFADGHMISVVGGGIGLYGDGVGTFEIAVFSPDGGFVNLFGDQVMGWQTKDEVTDVMIRFQKFLSPKYSKVFFKFG